MKIDFQEIINQGETARVHTFLENVKYIYPPLEAKVKQEYGC